MKSQNLSLFVFVDALGWEILQRHSFLDDVLEFKRPVETVLGYSSTCIPTILTGRLPREHEHFSFFYYSPSTSPFQPFRHLARLPDFITRRARVRRLLSKLVQRRQGYTGYFQLYNTPFRYLPLFDYSEKHDLYETGGINGKVATIFDYLRQRRIPFHLSDWRAPEQVNVDALTASLQQTRPRFAYLYLPELDGILHAHGTDSRQVEQKLCCYEQQLRRILKIAEAQYTTVHLHVFSDHGMTNVTGQCDLMRRIEHLGFEFGVDYAAVYDSTMARFWFLHERAREPITTALAQESRGRILKPDELTAYGCDFPGDKYGELIFLMQPGELICPSFMAARPIAGMHGYAPEHQDSVAMYASNVAHPLAPNHLCDLYPLMTSEARGEWHRAGTARNGEYRCVSYG